jgi:hypothetical protein
MAPPALRSLVRLSATEHVESEPNSQVILIKGCFAATAAGKDGADGRADQAAMLLRPVLFPRPGRVGAASPKAREL